MPILRRHELIFRLIKREVIGRYRGSALGMTWSLLNPLMMLAVYTFVFSAIFNSHWGNDPANSGTAAFAVNIFTGLIVFNLFAECINRAPSLMLENVNFVKRVVFPLEILPIVSVGSACFHAMNSLGILLVFLLATKGSLPISLLALPVAWAPIIMGCLACSWLLAALGVYIRDIGQLSSIVVSMLMFTSAVFYPLSALPDSIDWLARVNPLLGAIEKTRLIVVQGAIPSPGELAIPLILALTSCEICYRLFEKSRKGFADVI